MFKLNVLVITFLTSQMVLAKGVDPTKPFGYQASSGGAIEQQQLVLESIIHGDKIHTVVINSHVMKVGDYIGEYRLVAVNDGSVVLRSDTERLKLYIFSSKIIK